MTTNILAISGNDIFSGGGLYADLNTYAKHDLRGFLAVTCLTAMTEKGFEVFATDDEVFQSELDSLKQVPFSGIKIGLLPDVVKADKVLNFVKKHPTIPVVLDPVLVCKESHDVAVSALRTELLKFLPYVSIITPNLVEAEILSGQSINSQVDMESAARKLHSLGAKAVVIKGGKRLESNKAVDLFYDGETLEWLETPLSDKNNVGAGCTFASSIASHLTLGRTPVEAVRLAKDFVYQAILHSDEYGVVQTYDK